MMAYVMMIFIVWVLCYVVLQINHGHKRYSIFNAQTRDPEDVIFAITFCGFAGLLWPLVLTGYLVWFLAEKLVQTVTASTGEE